MSLIIAAHTIVWVYSHPLRYGEHTHGDFSELLAIVLSESLKD